MAVTILTGGTWTYSGDPATSRRDELRFWLSDTDESLPLLSNIELDYILDRYYDSTGSIVYTAAVAAEILAGKFATEVSVSADGVSVSTSDLQERFNRLAESLRDQAKAIGGVDEGVAVEPILTGLWSVGADPAIPPLMFGTGMNDNYEAGRQDYGDYSPGEGVSATEYGEPGVSSP
jgi:hypothetical protein